MIGAKAILQQLRNGGADVPELLKSVGLGRRTFEDENAWIPYEKYGNLLERCAQELNDDFFGLHAAALVDPRDIGLICYVGLSSRTLGDALLNIKRYYNVVNEAHTFKLSIGPKTVSITFDPVRPSFDQFRQAVELGDFILVRGYQAFIGEELSPVEMRFPHSFHGRSAYHESILGCPVSFDNDVGEIILSRDVLSLPVKSADTRLLDILLGYCEDVLSERAQTSSDLLTRFERTLLDFLPSGRAKADVIAAELGMSERTLARRLAESKTSFNRVLDTLRHELALKYIRRPDLQLSEVAFLLGYSTQSAFSVAFKRWTGKSPKALRTT